VKVRKTLVIPVDHPVFAGHFPGFPVVPGAMLLDEMLKAIEETRRIDLRNWHVAAAKFLSAVRPREALILEHEVTSAGSIQFTIRVDDRKVASGTLHEH
jgi:3-hydroxymyristoyl/3-hydroxydecanoyl-(acyl carrier protein) dehydratase